MCNITAKREKYRTRTHVECETVENPLAAMTFVVCCECESLPLVGSSSTKTASRVY